MGCYQAYEDQSKKKTFYDPKRESEPVKKKREEYCEELAELDPSKLIFLDEMGAALNLTPTYGRSVKGTRACGEKPTSPGTRISTLGAMTMNAMLTAMCFEGTLNGQVFLFFLEHFLCPLLRPGHIVILDNAKALSANNLNNITFGTIQMAWMPLWRRRFNKSSSCSATYSTSVGVGYGPQLKQASSDGGAYPR